MNDAAPSSAPDMNEGIDARTLKERLHAEIDDKFEEVSLILAAKRQELHALIDAQLPAAGPSHISLPKNDFLEREQRLISQMQEGTIDNVAKQKLAILRESATQQNITDISDQTLIRISLLGNRFGRPKWMPLMIKLFKSMDTGEIWGTQDLAKELHQSESTISAKMRTLRECFGRSPECPFRVCGSINSGWYLCRK